MLNKKIIVCGVASDVKSLTIGVNDGFVVLGVNDESADDSATGASLITAGLLPSQAVKLARALLEAAGVWGYPGGHANETVYKFIG